MRFTQFFGGDRQRKQIYDDISSAKKLVVSLVSALHLSLSLSCLFDDDTRRGSHKMNSDSER